MATAIVLPLLIGAASPLLAALIPGALLTVVGAHALEGQDNDEDRALTSHPVSPVDGAELHRIFGAIEIPSKSRRT